MPDPQKGWIDHHSGELGKETVYETFGVEFVFCAEKNVKAEHFGPRRLWDDGSSNFAARHSTSRREVLTGSTTGPELSNSTSSHSLEVKAIRRSKVTIGGDRLGDDQN
jgi:hypothetical protein